LLIFMVTLGVFLCTLELRRPWFGAHGRPATAAQLTNAVVCSRNWYREGMWHLKAGAYLTPRSVEILDPAARRPRTSYPPGLLVPIYLVSKLIAREPSVSTVVTYNLIGHFLIALLLALMVFALLRHSRCDHATAFLFALTPPCLYLLLPAPMYQHLIRYVPDNAVLLPFVLFVFLEVLRDGAGDKRWVRWLLAALQGVVAFGGILTDYLFALVALCVYLKRLARGQLGRGFLGFVAGSALFWLPVGLGLALYVLQLWIFDGLEDLAHKFQLWTSASSHRGFSRGLDSYFWQVHMVHGYGKVGVALLWASFAAVVAGSVYAGARRLRRKAVNHRVAQTLSLAFVFVAPCFMHVFLLKDHASMPVHDFVTLKFAPALATAPFVLLPVLFLAVFGANPSALSWARAKALVTRRPQEGGGQWSLLPLAMMVLAVGYLVLESPRVAPLLNDASKPDPALAVAKFIGAHTGYADVVFALDPECKASETRLLAYSMKEVHSAPSLQRVYAPLAHIDEDYTVNLLMVGSKPQGVVALDALIQEAYEERTADGLRLCKIHKQDFLELCKGYRVRAPKPPSYQTKKRRRRWQGERELVNVLTELGLQVEKLKEAQQQDREK